MIRRKINKKLESRPRAVNDWLKRYGIKNVTAVEVCRQPVSSIYQTVLNFLSRGTWEEAMKKYNYDDIFHLWAVLTLSDGSRWRIEKNQRVKIKRYSPRNVQECRGPRATNTPLTTFIERGESSGRYFWRYNPDTYNCQHFIRTLLNRNGIGSFNSFVSQNTRELMGPGTKKIAQAVSDIAATADVVLSGGAKSRPKRVRKRIKVSRKKASARVKRDQSKESKYRCK